MAKFNDCLNAKEIGEFCGRTVHKLNTSLIWTHDGKCIEIPAGFETDLASVPRIPVFYLLWGDRAHREAVLHDYLYRIGSFITLAERNCGKEVDVLYPEKEEADWMFREAMIGQGVSYYIYQPMYLGVRSCGGSSFHKMNVTDGFELDVRY